MSNSDGNGVYCELYRLATYRSHDGEVAGHLDQIVHLVSSHLYGAKPILSRKDYPSLASKKHKSWSWCWQELGEDEVEVLVPWPPGQPTLSPHNSDHHSTHSVLF